MPALLPSQIADFVTATLKEFKKDSWEDISLDLQDYVAMSSMLQKQRVAFEGGEQLQWQIKVQNTGAAKNTGLYDEDELFTTDVLKSATSPWTFQQTHFLYDEREPAFQSSSTRIVDLIKVRRHAALNDLVELMESNFWTYPADATTDSEQLKPRGLPYWIVGTSATSSFGFTGGNPNGHSTCAGLDSDAYPNWKNGAATYTNISATDLVRKWREAAVKCDFRTPVPHPETSASHSSKNYGFYTEYSVLGRLVELIQSRNDNLGVDLAAMEGQVSFMQNPVIWAPYLDANTIVEGSGGTSIYNPVYGISWNKFQSVFKSGEFMRENPPKQSPTQHRVKTVFIDTMQQYRCLNRRNNFVLYTTSA